MSNTGPLFPKTEIERAPRQREAEPLPPGRPDTLVDMSDTETAGGTKPEDEEAVVASRLREHLSETAPNSELLEFARAPGQREVEPLWREAAADALDQLWREAAAKGSLQVQSRRDSRGEYVRAVCERTDRMRLVCTAGTLGAALRAIANWGNQRYFRIDRGIGGVWRPWEVVTYANEIAAEEVVERLRKMYKGEFRFVAVEP